MGRARFRCNDMQGANPALLRLPGEKALRLLPGQRTLPGYPLDKIRIAVASRWGRNGHIRPRSCLPYQKGGLNQFGDR